MGRGIGTKEMERVRGERMEREIRAGGKLKGNL
jgi:hypothetical protein